MGTIFSCFDTRDEPRGARNSNAGSNARSCCLLTALRNKSIQSAARANTARNSAVVAPEAGGLRVVNQPSTIDGYQPSHIGRLASRSKKVGDPLKTEQEAGSEMHPWKQAGCEVDLNHLMLHEEDICATCLEGYSSDNPKILTACRHHYHLACIYEWLERKPTCPICSRVMEFSELKAEQSAP
ncbi:hypothetical protein Droror1_Dr00008280 [Drosera rotundifolia]